MKNAHPITSLVVFVLLLAMFGMAYFSLIEDSVTYDEQAHIGAGYSYISQRDMRLNPEHPPLLKDLAGLSIWLGSKITAEPINFPSTIDAWQNEANGQWDFGSYFLYKAGNNTDNIVLWARLPMILLGLLLGFYIFKWTDELYGKRAGLFALLLYAFSPTFLAHTRYVTTDVGAAAAFFIATYYFVKWLRNPSKKNLIVSGLVFGLAMLTKFSLALLVPYFILVTLVWIIAQSISTNKDGSKFKLKKGYLKQGGKKIVGLILIGLIGLALIWPVYQFHVSNYPAAKQKADIVFYFKDNNTFRTGIDALIWTADKPFLRAYSQYALGLIMVMRRSAGGNTTYFLGEVNSQSWWYYFPVVYFLKVPLAFHILSVMALLFALNQVKKPLLKKPTIRLLKWLQSHPAEFALLTFFIVYWIVSIRSNLNIGVRHVLPVFCLLYVLVSGQIAAWLGAPWRKMKEPANSFKEILLKTKLLVGLFFKTYFKYLLMIILVGWYICQSISVFPHYLAYFNESIGGPVNGYKYVTDSNLDWGQDLKRLAQWVDKNNVDHIYLYYFGGSSPEYYLGDKVWPWWSDRNPQDIQSGEYLAISATLLQEGRSRPGPGFNQTNADFFYWLDNHKLVEQIGYSIFVFQIK